VDQTETRRDLYQGFGDTFTRSVELVVSPMLFAALGLLFDRLFGTSPVLAIVFGVIGFVGGCLRAYYAYVERVKTQDVGKPWSKT
jgi:F0F1-type ATP synthase assembly protein I